MELQEINKWLRRGDKQKIAKIGNYEYSNVLKALNGTTKNSPVIAIAEMIAEKNKQKIKEQVDSEFS